MIESIRTFLRFGEAALALLLSYLALKVLGFRRIGRFLGRPHGVSPRSSSDAERHTAQIVRRAIRNVRRRVPDEPSCLVRSLAALAMLRRRGIDCTLYLGVAPGTRPTLRAHAWVRAGSFIVVGRRNQEFTVVMTFNAGPGAISESKTED